MSLHSWPNADLVAPRSHHPSPRSPASAIVPIGGATSPSPPSTPPTSRRATHPYDPYDIPVSRSGRPLRRPRLQGARLAAFLTASVCLTSLLLLVVQSLFGVSSISSVLKLQLFQSCRDEPELEAKVQLVLPLRQTQTSNDTCRALVSALVHGYEPIIVGWDLAESSNITENHVTEAKAVEAYLRSLPWDTSLIDAKSHPERVLVMDPRRTWLQLPPVWLVSRLNEARSGMVVADADECSGRPGTYSDAIDPNRSLTAIAGRVAEVHKVFAMRAGMMRSDAPIWSSSVAAVSASLSDTSSGAIIQTDYTSRIFSSTSTNACLDDETANTTTGMTSPASGPAHLVAIGQTTPDALLGPAPPPPSLDAVNVTSASSTSPATASSIAAGSTVTYRSSRPACQLVNEAYNPPWTSRVGRQATALEAPAPALLVAAKTGQTPIVVVIPQSAAAAAQLTSGSDSVTTSELSRSDGAGSMPAAPALWDQTWFSSAFPTASSRGASSSTPWSATSVTDDPVALIVRQRLVDGGKFKQVKMYAQDGKGGGISSVSIQELCHVG